MVRLGFLIATLIAGLAAVVVWLANRAAFFPSKYPEGDWDACRRIGAQEITIPGRDGVILGGWWLKVPSARLATLFLHGNAGNVTNRVWAMKEIVAAGSSILLLDYRGYGRSTGNPTESGLYRDAMAAYEYLQRTAGTPIVLHGESLGTAVATHLAVEIDCAGLILEAPFPSARAVAARVLPWLGPLLVWGFETRKAISKVRCPILVIHGDRDNVIPFDLGQQVFAAAPEPKQFWEIRGAGHNDLAATAGPAYRERLEAFYRSLHR